MKGMTLEKKEARAEKEEAEKYQKFQQELVNTTIDVCVLTPCKCHPCSAGAG